MAHNFYSRGPEGLEVANRRALGSDDNAVAQGFTHFASTRSGPWKPLGVQGPGSFYERRAKPPSVLAALPAPDRSMCLATQYALDIAHDEVQDSRVSFDVERVASFASFQAEVLLRSSPLNGTFLLTVDPVIRQRAAELRFLCTAVPRSGWSASAYHEWEFRFNWPGLFADEYPGTQLVFGHVVPCCYDLGLTPGETIVVLCAHRYANKAETWNNVLEPALREAVSLNSARSQMWPCHAGLKRSLQHSNASRFRSKNSAERPGVPLTFRHLQMRAGLAVKTWCAIVSDWPHAWPITLVKAIPAWGAQSELLDEAMQQGPAQVVSTLLQDVALMKGFWGKFVINDLQSIRQVFLQRCGIDMWRGVAEAELLDSTTIGPGAASHLTWLMKQKDAATTCPDAGLTFLRRVLLLLMQGATDHPHQPNLLAVAVAFAQEVGVLDAATLPGRYTAYCLQTQLCEHHRYLNAADGRPCAFLDDAARGPSQAAAAQQLANRYALGLLAEVDHFLAAGLVGSLVE
ncbi:unnamed protein product [Symbiodinium sp. KB8]|nr:unnamed protein product [Symbiodinium sp. KB8]